MRPRVTEAWLAQAAREAKIIFWDVLPLHWAVGTFSLMKVSFHKVVQIQRCLKKIMFVCLVFFFVEVVLSFRMVT